MRNGLAGSKAGKSRTAKFYHDNPDAAKKRDEYNKEYNSTEKRKKYRAVLQAINRRKGTHGNHDGMDEAHVSKDKTVKQSQSKNRGDKKRQFFKS